MKKFIVSIQLVLVACFVLFAWHCKRENAAGSVSPPAQVQLVPRTNPFSLSNMKKVMAKLKAEGPKSGNARATFDLTVYSQYVYYRIDPTNMTPEQLKYFENSSGSKMMDFPFGNGAVYGDSSLTEANIQQLRDGKLYGITPVGDTLLNKLPTFTSLQYQALDTILYVPDSDSGVVSMAMREAGFSPQLLGICLFKKPHGQVRYQDTERNTMEPVRRARVWALVFGIPVSTETDDNGYYEIPYRFSFGTIMGVMFSNYRVDLKPLTTTSTTVGSVLAILKDFLIGPNYIYGGVGSCAMRDNKNFDFYGHTKQRYWSQILNAYSYHDQYCAQENIPAAPGHMVCYAVWRSGGSAFGNMSTPLFGHVNFGTGVVEKVLNGMWGGNVNLATQFPSLLGYMNVLIPDMIINVGSDAEPSYYSSQLSQTLFHELGHASQFNQVGSSWYLTLINAEIVTQPASSNPYGSGTGTDAGVMALAESWAQYIGTNFALRRYPAGFMKATDPFAGNTVGQLYSLSTLIEGEKYFFGAKWIPSGMYHDLADGSNAAEPWDNVSGITIRQMYMAFQPNVLTICAYKSKFASDNPTVGLWSVFDQYEPICGTRFLSAAINQNYTRNNCSVQPGGSVLVNLPAGAFSSTISVADANAQAQAYAQAYANQNGTCPCVTCTGPSKKCINGVCTLGSKEYTASQWVGGSPGRYKCTYHYEWPDGTRSQDYTEYSEWQCAL
ncbi:MAG: hypothetical protein J7623_02905 [Chitinophaga sp.]|uniref:DUF5977 domain-containing protein n=1 Tax=Chitinophaga sp. TaxID=1869181 RepID=UPI001B08246F|nr:DUF5977 domain-containing protein [Chitinophaga sp.]MBO9727567.1 hypothetical protein [Chitinophaga sp.]